MNKYKVALQELGRIAEACERECAEQLDLSHWWEIGRKARFSSAGEVWRVTATHIKALWTTLHIQEQLDQAQSGETLQ